MPTIANIEDALEQARARLTALRTENPRYRRGLRRWTEFLQNRVGYSVGYSTARRYETGEYPLTSEYLLAVCLATDTSPNWVLTGKGPQRLSDIEAPDTVSVLEELLARARRIEAGAGR